MAPIRIMLVDDHSQIHRSLSVLQEINADLLLVAHASNGKEAIQVCDEVMPNVIMMDVVMPVMDGIAATRIIHERHPKIKIMALSSFQDEESVQEMLRAGAAGYLLKDSSPQEIANSIRAVFSGTTVFSPEITEVLLHPQQTSAALADYDLSARELDVLTLMVKGNSNKEIAQRLSISVPTVKFHVRSILSKLQATGRVEAVAIAVENHLTS